ncbi:MAG: LAGLIDADG family homing endonuclease, partial [Pseudonocardiaceae bacterium]
PEPSGAIEWPDDRVALLGQLIGDGSYLAGQPLRYATASEENSALVTQSAERFGNTVKRYRGRGTWHQLLLSGNGSRWHPAGVNKWLRDLGVFGQRSHEKRVPEEAFRLGNQQIAILLRHLWATDGCIFVRGRKESGPPAVYFATASIGLAHDVAALLLRLGIVSRIRTVTPSMGRPWHTVSVSGSDQQRMFMAEVGAYGPREEQASRLTAYLASTRSNTNVDTLPRETFDRVRALMAGRGVSTRRMATLRGTSYGGSAHFRFAPSRASVAEYAEILDDDALRNQARSDLFWDRVVRVVSEGEEDVYDLTVPGPASWLADAVVSHNSGAIEQDSDIVMFIHRDPLSEDMQAKGTAEVIVAKHRNGPTGTVRLAFMNQYTKFASLAKGIN